MTPLLPITESVRSATLAAEAVAADLIEVERVLARTLESPRPHVARLVAHLGHYRGKRLRPMLLLLTGHACGQVNRAHHVLGAVVEMIHTATLVHDDVLDHATLRRHVPTVNAGWGNQHSVLLGDYLFTQAFHLSATLGDARACEIIGRATNRVCEGELQQVGERGNLELTEESYFSIIDGKTAELTSCCCRLGSLYSGASPELVEQLSAFGRHLGIAFQIADDLLDIVGNERDTGKSLGTDLEQQKLTLPLIHLLQKAPAETGAIVRQILASPGNHKCEALAPHLAASLEYSRQRAEEHASQARAALAGLPASQYRAILEDLTRQVVHRRS